MQPPVILDALTRYKPSGMRQRVVHRKDICVVEDCYNAGPDSMKAAIHAFGSMQRPAKGACRKIFIMGDMLELGDYAPQAHYEAGQCAVREDIDIVNLLRQTQRGRGQGRTGSVRPQKGILF